MSHCSNAQTVTFHLTHNCNLRCPYCYTGEKVARGMADNVVEEAVDFALGEARGQGVQSLNVMFFGGEPMLRMDLITGICDRMNEREGDLDLQYGLSTNGLLLSAENLAQLGQRRVHVSVSIDGPPDIQDRQRPFANGRGSASALAGNIPRLLEWNPCTDVKCVVTPEVAGELDRSVRWLAEEGFAYITPQLDYSASWTRDDLKRLQAALKRLAEWYVDQHLAGRPVYVGLFDERIATRTQGPLGCGERCAMGVRQYSIAPSGRLYPCVQFVGDDMSSEYAIGDVWTGFDLAKRRALLAGADQDKPECAGCQIKQRCSSWCACINWSTTGRVDRASPVLCEYERLVMPIADSVGNRLWKKRNATFVHKFYNPAFPVLNFAETLILKEKNHAPASTS